MEISEVILVIGLMIIGFWRRPVGLDRDFIFSIVAGFAVIFIGITWIDDYLGLSVCIGLIGLIFVTSAAMVVFVEGGPARGWSQVRSWFKRGSEG